MPGEERHEARTSVCSPWRAWALHAFTAFGAVIGLLALVALFNDQPRAAVYWLLLALVIDGLDGPLARAWGVAEALPNIDGFVLDVIVDFFTAVVPLAFLWRLDMLPGPLELPVVGFTVVCSALWYARRDLESADHWFNGFPAQWNLVVPTLLLLGTAQMTNAVAVAALAALQLTSVKFVHPMRVVNLRRVTLAVTILWLAAVAILVEFDGPLPWGWKAVLLVGPAYYAAITIRRTRADEDGLARVRSRVADSLA